MYLRTGRKLHDFIWTEFPITEEVITRVEELGKEDKHPLMENRPIFEWIPWKFLLEEQKDEEYFDNLINDLQHHHNDEDNSDYVSDDYDGDDDSLGSWEAKYAAMDEEEGMIVTYDDISEYGDISDHKYGRNENKEEK